MKFVRLLVIPAVAGLLMTSCATFPNKGVPEVADVPATGVKKVPLTYSLTTGSELFKGNRVESAPAATRQFERPLEAALTGSGRFSSVRQGKGGGVHLDVDMLNHGNAGAAMASGFITGFSMFTIPGFAKDNYKLTATARNAAGKSRRYELEDGVTTVFWLPLIVAAPFSNPKTVVPEVHENMYRNLIRNMENDGIIPRASN